MRIARLLACVAVIALGVRLAAAQVVEVRNASGPVAITGPWLVQEGESGIGNARQVQGFPTTGSDASLPAVLWLRTTIKLDESIASPALLIAVTAQDCEVFLNGAPEAECRGLLGANGFAHRSMLVPLTGMGAGQPVLLSIRLLRPRALASGNLGIGPGDVLLGNAHTLAAIRTARDAERFYSLLPQMLLCAGEILGGAVLLILFAYDRRRREYLWFALFLWLDGPCSLESVFDRVYPLFPAGVVLFFDFFGLVGRYAPLIGFLAAFTNVRVNRWIRGYQWVLVTLPLLLAFFNIEQHRESWSVSSSWTLGALLWVQLPFAIGSLLFLFWQWKKGNNEAALLIPSFLLANAVEIVGLTLPRLGHFRAGRFAWDYDDLSMFFFLVSIAPVMILRHRRITREHARATAELDAAREIQQRLVPARLPEIAGCRIEAAYLPADEVGGDFYQVLPRPDGSTFLAVGDVSGKGLKAAMTGALAIGALRTLAAEHLPPGEVLTRLNAELVRAENGGFVTCFCAVIEPDCTLRFANAGHLAPYRNGLELESPGALPLGLSADAIYAEQSVGLEAGDRLTLLSDGVVEAQNAGGELFGFERARGMSRETARAIAEAAQSFGQADDITVLTLERAQFA